MSVATPLFNPTLESVQQAFDHWRATRPKRGRTPISLQRRAGALLGSYPASHICSALKINDTALKCWAGKSSTTTGGKPIEEAFIELPIAPAFDEPSALVTSGNKLSIELGDGVRLSIDGHFSLEHILSVACRYKQGVRS